MNKTRVSVTAAIVAVLCTVGQAADVALKVAAINAIPVAGGPQSTVNASPGDMLTAEVYLSGWSPSLLRAYQVQLDPASFSSGTAGSLSVVLPGSTIDTAHSAYVYSGLSSDPADEVSFVMTDTSSAAIRFTAGVFVPATGAVDRGTDVYLATVMLLISEDAEGVFDVTFSGATVLRDDAAPPAAITPLNFVAATVTVATCKTLADCGDLDDDGIRDDPCLHYGCVDGACVETPRGQGQSDMGGQFGSCENDGTCDGNDRFLALACFGNDWAGPTCEDAPPAAINVDAGGAFGSCVLDGVCDGNDAFAALNCFSGDQSCACGGGPAPQTPEIVEVVGATGVSLRPSARRIRPGEPVHVDVYFDDAVKDLRGYQLHLRPTGGLQGDLELVDIAIEPRPDRALRPDWQAFNPVHGQMVAGLDGPGQATGGAAYLATFTYRSSRDAAGTFVVELLHDHHDAAQRTFLFPTPNHAMIAVRDTSPAVIEVSPAPRVRADDPE